MLRQLRALRICGLACVFAASLVAGCGGGAGQPFTLAGTVRSDAGAPIAGATVAATLAGETQPAATTRTSTSGAYRLALPPATYDVTASATGYQEQTRRVTITASQPAFSFDFVLTPTTEPPPPPTNLGGRVTAAATSLPIADAAVTATVEGETTPAEATATDADGRYGFWLPAGTWVIRVTAAGFTPAARTVVLSVGGANADVNFALAAK